MSDNIHGMITRSKASTLSFDNDLINDDNCSEIDEHGNLKDFIDYDCNEDFDRDELNKQLLFLSRSSSMNSLSDSPSKKRIKKRKKGKKKGSSTSNLNSLLLNYLILKATDKANEELMVRRKSNRKDKIKVIEEDIDLNQENISLDISNQSSAKPIIQSLLDDTQGSESDSSYDPENNPDMNPSDDCDDISIDDSDISEKSEESFITEDSEESVQSNLTDVLTDNSSNKSDIESGIDSDEEYEYIYDELDEKYEGLVESQTNMNCGEKNMEFYHYLEKDRKETLLKHTEEIYKYNESNIPLRFKIIESEMDIKTKALAIENIDKLSEMDMSSGEYSKMDHWINGLIRIPFGKYNKLPIDHSNTTEEKRKFIQQTYQLLNNAIYGHKEAKTHIVQVIGKWIQNPDSGGNVLAIQGPMGNGKTTLVKEGISKVLNRPFAFIALGGASDSAFFDGHSYTYEGSHWGRIIQILQESKCMNPVIYFDELDKISDTPKGDEIVHMLTHLTDPSQNSLFQDNYYPGINIDLSKALFIFSYNDENNINKILKDRMYVIHTKGFKIEDKLKICRDFLIPEIFKTFVFETTDILFTDQIIQYIISNHTSNEEGVRNLKRCIESIVSKINIHILSNGDSDLSFKLTDIQIPFSLTIDHINELLKESQLSQPPPFGMYN